MDYQILWDNENPKRPIEHHVRVRMYFGDKMVDETIQVSTNGLENPAENGVIDAVAARHADYKSGNTDASADAEQIVAERGDFS